MLLTVGSIIIVVGVFVGIGVWYWFSRKKFPVFYGKYTKAQDGVQLLVPGQPCKKGEWLTKEVDKVLDFVLEHGEQQGLIPDRAAVLRTLKTVNVCMAEKVGNWYGEKVGGMAYPTSTLWVCQEHLRKDKYLIVHEVIHLVQYAVLGHDDPGHVLKEWWRPNGLEKIAGVAYLQR